MLVLWYIHVDKKAVGAEINTGDGAGILIQVPHKFFKRETPKSGFELPDFENYGVGMVFFPGQESKYKEAKEIFDICKNSASALGFNFVQSYDPDIVGDVNAHCPAQMQMFMYINSASELIFCPATDQLLNKPIASFKEDTYQVIQNKYSAFMSSLSAGTCLAREG